MARAISEIEAEIRSLAHSEQERLLRALLEELDGPADPDAEQLWLDEVRRRSAELDFLARKCLSAFARASSNED
jgi:hypothetical protein